jgi:cis-3-alkyl-4-acyloxetan-2-one decarboxylase
MSAPDFSDAPPLPKWLAQEFPFKRRILHLPTGDLSFVDDGHGPPVLLLHGNPTWGYLWRKIIPPLLEQGFRVIAPDLYGFGLSAKPRHPSEHQLSFHVEAITTLCRILELESPTLVAQDWGGPIILGAAMESRITPRALVLGNTAVLKPKKTLRPTPFHRFSHFPFISELAFRGLLFPVPVLNRVQGDRRSISRKDFRAYLHPIWKPRNSAGPLGLARMVPHKNGHPSIPLLNRIGDYVLGLNRPTTLIWGVRDPVLGRTLKRHREALPHAKVVETTAGHFLQEEVPLEFVNAICDSGSGSQTNDNQD